MIYVIATTPMKPENKDDFIKGHKACTAETLKEKGCISYDGHVSVNNPNLYVVVERWETRDDLNAHGRAPHMKVWREVPPPASHHARRCDLRASSARLDPASGRGQTNPRTGRFNQESSRSSKEAASMIRATKVLGQHRWTHAAADTVVLDFDDR